MHSIDTVIESADLSGQTCSLSHVHRWMRSHAVTSPHGCVHAWKQTHMWAPVLRFHCLSLSLFSAAWGLVSPELSLASDWHCTQTDTHLRVREHTLTVWSDLSHTEKAASTSEGCDGGSCQRACSHICLCFDLSLCSELVPGQTHTRTRTHTYTQLAAEPRNDWTSSGTQPHAHIRTHDSSTLDNFKSN